MASLTPKKLWLLAGLGTAIVAGHLLLSGQPQQAATLTRLAEVNSCLSAANQMQAVAAQTTLGSLKAAVAENRYQARDRVVLHQAERLHANTRALTDTLHWLRQQWPGSGTPAALARLSTHFRQYTDSVWRYTYDIGPRGRGRPLWPTTNPEAVAGLSQLSTPVAIAALTRLEAQVRQVADTALMNAATKVGRTWDPFEKVGLFAVPVSTTVAPGGQYQASLLVTSAAVTPRLRMQANGHPLTIDPRTSHGLVTFQVPLARAGQPDTVQTQWQGQISLTHNGRDSSFRLTVPYRIAKRSQL